jgi:hypothetical protein
MTDLPRHRIQELKDSVDSLSGHIRIEEDTPIYYELRAKYDADKTMETLFPGLLAMRGRSC